jgi:peptide/nickel transport system substrate-binding protein
MKKPTKGLIAAVTALSLIASACGDDGSSGAADTSGDEEPQKGGTIYILTQLEQITNLDPQRNYTGSDLSFAGGTMHRTLTTYDFAEGDAGSEIVPDLATDTGRPSDDAKTWEFTLRDGVTFEDGSAITCADVAYGTSRTFATDVITNGPTYAISYLDIPDDGYPGPYTATADEQALFDEAVSCSPDNKTITFKLKVPVADFNYTVSLLSFSPVPKAADTGEKYDTAPVSSGPYKIESYVPGKALTLVRNENWSPESDPVRKAWPDRFVYQFALEATVIDERMIADSGDDKYAVSADGLQPETLPTVFGDPRFEDRRLDGYDPYVLYTNFDVSAVNCVQVRKAVYLGLDREALRTAGGGPYTGDFADGFIKPALADDYAPGKLPDGTNADGTPNIEAATALLEEAKTECPDVYERATTDGLKFMYGDTPSQQKAVAIWTESMKAIGIVIKPEPVEPSKYYPTVQNPETEFDLAGGGWAPDWANASTIIPELFTAAGGFNYTRNVDDPAYPAFEAKVEEAKAETDRAKQGELWQELNQYVLDEMWALPRTFTKIQDLWGSKVGNAYRWAPAGTFNFGDLYVKS